MSQSPYYIVRFRITGIITPSSAGPLIYQYSSHTSEVHIYQAESRSKPVK